MSLRTRLERLERVIAPSLPPTLSEAELACIDEDRLAWWASMTEAIALGCNLWNHHGTEAVKQFIGSLSIRAKLSEAELHDLAVVVDLRRQELEAETPQLPRTDLGLVDLEPWPDDDDDGEDGNGQYEPGQLIANLTPR